MTEPTYTAPPVQVWPGVALLTGPGLRSALECVLIAVRHRRLSGLTTTSYEHLAAELHTAMAATGHPDTPARTPADTDPMILPPTVPIAAAATRLRLSHRQTRRLAPQLGGRLVGGRWLVDELALREHLEGLTQ